MSGSATEVFHQEMLRYHLKPSYEYQVKSDFSYFAHKSKDKDNLYYPIQCIVIFLIDLGGSDSSHSNPSFYPYFRKNVGFSTPGKTHTWKSLVGDQKTTCLWKRFQSKLVSSSNFLNLLHRNFRIFSIEIKINTQFLKDVWGILQEILQKSIRINPSFQFVTLIFDNVDFCRVIYIMLSMMKERMRKRRRALILYGTETGRSETFAQRLQEVKSSCFNCRVSYTLEYAY